MASNSTARPAKKPARAAVVGKVVETSVTAKKLKAGLKAGPQGKLAKAEPRAKKRIVQTKRSTPPTAVIAAEQTPAVAADLPLTERVLRVIESELKLIETIVRDTRRSADRGTEAERRTRMLASLARTLTELKKAREGGEQRPEQDDDRPRDLDELRRRLSERLARRLAETSSVPDGGDVAG